MNTAFIFPGQASQFVGMGKDLYDSNNLARFYYDRADKFLPFDFLKICFEGSESELKQTRVTQPAIFVHSVVVNEIVRQKRITVDAFAGHSVGEYSALVATGVLNFVDALDAVALRGELMQNIGDERPGTMAAIIGLEQQKVEDVCEAASNGKIVAVPANFNASGQIVISGDVTAVENAMELAKKAGAKRAIRLEVSGAFHSPLMEPAAEKLGAKLKELDMRPPNVPIFMNVTGKPENSQVEIKELLIKQLTHPVRWRDTMSNMCDEGIDQFVEIGPGKVLQGLAKRATKESKLNGVKILGIGTLAEVEAFDPGNN